MSILRIFACALAVCLSAAAYCASNFQLSVFPVFVGGQKAVGLVPLKVSIENAGPDAIGVVHLQSGGYEMDYPVELPEGSSKDLIVYAETSTAFYDAYVELRTNHGGARKAIDPAGMTPSQGDYFLEIGGNPGDLGFLAKGSTASGQVSPENAPERVSAYEGCNMILLAAGSERLSDGAVKALKLYLLKGGLLVFPSGVASPLLTDGRWQGILPVRPLQPRTEKSDSLLRQIATVHEEKKTMLGPPIGGPFSVVDFAPLQGTKTAKEEGRNLLAARNYGFGKAVFWAFDPLRGALRDWDGLGQFFRRSAHYALPDQQAVIHADFLGLQQTGEYGGAGYSMGSYPPGSGPGAYASPYGYETPDSAFQVTMPSPASIGTVLGLYFLCVIPLNFFVLKRMGKRHWGWVTSCVISVVFAGIMLSEASELYGIPTSHEDKVVVIGQKGFEKALAIGSSQMFAARGGAYDLSMQGVESITPAADNMYYGYSGTQNSLEMFSPVDIGEVQVKEAQFKNLGFGEMSFEQELDSSNMPTVTKKGQNYLIKCANKLANVCFLSSDGGVYNLGDVPAGGTITVNRWKTGGNMAQSGQLMPYLAAVNPWVQNGECVLMATAPDLPVGPNLGKKLPPDPVLIYFLGDDL